MSNHTDIMDIAATLLEQAAQNEREDQPALAEMLYRGVIATDATHTGAWLRLGTLLAKRGRADESKAALTVAACRQLLQFQADDAQTRFQLGLALSHGGYDELAAQAYRTAAILAPTFAEAYCNLGIALYNLLQTDAAATAQRHSVQLVPGSAAFHCNLAHSLLASGALAAGFAEWQWRPPSPLRDFAQTPWDGRPFAGKTLLVHADQGYGDTIQFSRYLPRLAEIGGTVVVECRAPLAGLLSRVAGVARVIVWGEPLPPFDAHVPMSSLAHFLGDDDSTPQTPPYLSAAADSVIKWRARLGTPTGRRVGLVWSGNPRSVDTRRALPPAMLSALAAIRGITLYSLQRDTPSPASLSCLSLGEEIGDFDDLAAILETLDLLISVDTAAAHLAGALGRPTWTLLHAIPDWRWLPADRPNVWYPHMRLYRQPRPGAWQDVLDRVAEDLAVWARP